MLRNSRITECEIFNEKLKNGKSNPSRSTKFLYDKNIFINNEVTI